MARRKRSTSLLWQFVCWTAKTTWQALTAPWDEAPAPSQARRSAAAKRSSPKRQAAPSASAARKRSADLDERSADLDELAERLERGQVPREELRQLFASGIIRVARARR